MAHSLVMRKKTATILVILVHCVYELDHVAQRQFRFGDAIPRWELSLHDDKSKRASVGCYTGAFLAQLRNTIWVCDQTRVSAICKILKIISHYATHEQY